jgi:hypothetical protein
LPIIGEISQDLFGIKVGNDGSLGDSYVKILPRRPRTLFTRASTPGFGTVSTLDSEIGQRVDVLSGDKKDTTPMTTVTAIRPTSGDEFLSAKADATVPTTARFHLNSGFINEFHRSAQERLPHGHKKGPLVGPFLSHTLSSYSGMTLTYFLLLGPLVSNTTLPEAFAKIV